MTHEYKLLQAKAAVKFGWRAALASVGAPPETVFFAGEQDTEEWSTYNRLVDSYFLLLNSAENNLQNA